MHAPLKKCINEYNGATLKPPGNLTCLGQCCWREMIIAVTSSIPSSRWSMCPSMGCCSAGPMTPAPGVCSDGCWWSGGCCTGKPGNAPAAVGRDTSRSARSSGITPPQRTSHTTTGCDWSPQRCFASSSKAKNPSI
jgi:hypothetical protein